MRGDLLQLGRLRGAASRYYHTSSSSGGGGRHRAFEGESPTLRLLLPAGRRPAADAAQHRTSFASRPLGEPRRDLRNIVHAAAPAFPAAGARAPDLQVQVLRSLFFRNKGAYVVGRIINGHHEVPFAVPLLQNERGELYAIRCSWARISLLVFSPSRAPISSSKWEAPAAFVSFLRWLMRGSRAPSSTWR